LVLPSIEGVMPKMQWQWSMLPLCLAAQAIVWLAHEEVAPPSL
jgi:hypothetical protein